MPTRAQARTTPRKRAQARAAPRKRAQASAEQHKRTQESAAERQLAQASAMEHVLRVKIAVMKEYIVLREENSKLLGELNADLKVQVTTAENKIAGRDAKIELLQQENKRLKRASGKCVIA